MSARAGDREARLSQPAERRRLRRRLARRPVRHVEAALLGQRFERVGQADDGLGRAQHEKAVRSHDLGKTLEHVDLGLLVEIDQHVAAEHHVERAELREIVQQVERLVLHHRAQLGDDLPRLADLREILDQHLNRQPALDLELAVDAGLGFLQDLRREIRPENLDAPADKLAGHFLETDRKRIRLLAGGGSRAPDTDLAVACAACEQRRHDGGAEMLERDLVAEEEGLVRGHRLDDLDDQGLGAGGLELLDQPGEALNACFARHRQEPAFDQVLLVGRQRQTRALLEQLAQVIVVERGHARSPWNKRTTLGAIGSIGSTAEQSPALAAEPGMPQTTLVTSSWAMTLPPCATIVAAPCVPSWPMPVRINARMALLQISVADWNRGSTAGLQKLTGGPSS